MMRVAVCRCSCVVENAENSIMHSERGPQSGNTVVGELELHYVASPTS